jgi:tripartite-type tricarboxylate transporter receptor subunit TctC
VTVAAHPGKLSYGTYGPGSGAHFIGELLKFVAGVHITHIPYRGEAPAGTPQPVISKIALEVNRIIKMPDIAKKILELGFEPVGWSPEHVNTFLREQMAITKKLVDGGRIQI